MPILDLQRRLREAGRIRIGVQVPNTAKNARSKTRPEKLDTFRLTSQDEDVIRSAAGMFGGTVQRWDEAPTGEQWEVITETSVIPVVVPPAATAFSQWYEQWAAGGCLRRCDGVTEMISDTPCLCAADDDKVCTPHSRLNVILRDLPGLGVWRLETQGWYAATELAGTVEVCIQAATRGQLLPAVLRLEQRQVKRPGETVKKFAVPVLDIQVTPSALGLVVGSQPAVGNGTWQPIEAPAMVEIGAGDTAALIKDAGTDGPEKRKNSPPELPATGLKPRGRKTAEAEPHPEPEPAGDGGDGGYEEHRPASTAQPDTAGLTLYRRLKDPMSQATKDKLKELAAFHERRLTVGDFDNDPEWLAVVQAVLDGTPREGRV